MAKTNGNGTETVQEVPRAEMDKATRRKMFEAYSKHDKVVSSAETALATAVAKRSEVVLEIIEKCGNGPFNFDGRILTATKRGKKDGTTVAYFRGPGENQIDEI